MLRTVATVRLSPHLRGFVNSHLGCCVPSQFSVATYTHQSKNRKTASSTAPLLLSVQVDSDLSKELQHEMKIGPRRKGKIKVSPHATFDLALLRTKLEHCFPGLDATRYKIRYTVGEKMNIPRRCSSDEEAREALQHCARLQTPLHLSLHPDYFTESCSSLDGQEQSQSQRQGNMQRKSSHFTLPQHLKDMPNPDNSPSFTLVSFYRFKPVPDPDQQIARMHELWRPFKVLGRVYVAEEGVNAQMAVPTSVLKWFEEASSSLEVLRHEGDGFRVNCDSREMSSEEFHARAPFRALHIRRRRQVLVDGLSEELDWRAVPDELSPLEWHHRIPSSLSTSPAPVILDCRNKYESQVGRFNGAIPLDTDTFQESWAALETILKDKDPSTPIMTYCTGGIRCVKINAYLIQKMGFNNTSRLKGGIIAYARQRKEWAEEVALQREDDSSGSNGSNDGSGDGGVSVSVNDCVESKFKGVNYVFDERMGERITPDVLSQCQSCGCPHDMFSNCRHCSIRFLQCGSCAFDLSSCCSTQCRDGYLSAIRDKHVLQSQKHERAKSVQQKKQRGKTRGRGQRRGYATSSHVCSERASNSNSNSNSSSNSSSSEAASLSLLSYCEQLSTPEPPLLTSLREETLRICSPASHRMLCDPLQGRLLAFLSTLHRPKAILELGTFTGYSALCLAEGLRSRRTNTPEDTSKESLQGTEHALPFLVTVDSDPATTRTAKTFFLSYLAERNFSPDPLDHIRIESVDGNGADVLLAMQEETEHTFDIVFLDANKKGYVDYVKCLMGEGDGGVGRIMLSPGALIVVDNTLWKGLVVDEIAPSTSSFEEDVGESKSERRMRTLAKAMHLFNTYCRDHPRLEPLLLPIRDGLSIVRYC